MIQPMPQQARSQDGRPDIVTVCFLAVLAVWMVIPFAARGGIAQDAVPYVVAGRIQANHPHDVYAALNGNVHDLKPRFKQEACQVGDLHGHDCDVLAVAFISTPLALPFAWILRNLSAATAGLIMRLAASAMLAGGMWLIYARLQSRSRHARGLLLATAILLTPMATIPIGLGQTSPILFLSACLGISSAKKRWPVGSALAWVGAVIFKGFPGALVALLVWRRRWRFITVAVGALAVILLVTTLLVPLSIVGDFLRTSRELANVGPNVAQQSSVNALIRLIIGSSTAAQGAALGGSVALAIAVCWFGLRGVDDDVRWVVGYLAVFIISPVVWWHYLWVAFAAIAVALAAQRRLTTWMVALLPAFALLTLPSSWPTNASNGPYPAFQALFLLATTATVLWLCHRSRSESAEPQSPTIGSSALRPLRSGRIDRD